MTEFMEALINVLERKELWTSKKVVDELEVIAATRGQRREDLHCAGRLPEPNVRLWPVPADRSR